MALGWAGVDGDLHGEDGRAEHSATDHAGRAITYFIWPELVWALGAMASAERVIAQ